VRFIGWLVFVAIVSAVSSGNAAGAIEYQNEAFDPGAKALPPIFRGADLSAVYAVLERHGPPQKGEYETTDTFNRRAEEAGKQEVLGQLQATSIYAFSNEISPSSLLYDADRGVLDFQRHFGSLGGGTGGGEAKKWLS
jgi:hypothetical protein